MLKPTDLSAVKSDGYATILAVGIYQNAAVMDTVGDPMRAAVRDALIKFAHELLALHDVDPTTVLVSVESAGDRNGAAHAVPAFSNES